MRKKVLSINTIGATLATLGIMGVALAYQTFHVTHVGVDPVGATIFVGVDQTIAGDRCTAQTEFKWSLSSPYVTQILAVALSAQATGVRSTSNCRPVAWQMSPQAIG